MSDGLSDRPNYNKWRRDRHPKHFLKEQTKMFKNIVDELIEADFGATCAPVSAVGNKLDANKPKVSLIPSEAILEMAKAFTYGAAKYEADNFKKGIAYRRLIDATLRHVLAIADNEDVDQESGNLHVGHALASLAMLCYMMKNKPQMDDRFKGGQNG